MKTYETIIIGAGITGLTIAHHLTLKNKNIHLLEQQNRTGGQIHTHTHNGYTYESGPNTGTISNPEVAELFQTLTPHNLLEPALPTARRRLIWKNNNFHPLPTNPITALTTPLFTPADKLRILTEPFRPKGTNPDETIAQLTLRRLGKSYLHYAVDPFINGIYAGDPTQLTTRHALPKLYQLEQQHGSFIRGAITKALTPKTPRDKQATKQIFSTHGGLSTLTQALTNAIGHEKITLGIKNLQITPSPNPHQWTITYQTPHGPQTLTTHNIITTTPAYTLPTILPFITPSDMQKITNLHYTPVIQASVGIPAILPATHNSFGGLIPSHEHRPILGILHPSTCFTHRSPQGSTLLSIFLGGEHHPDIIHKTDTQITQTITTTLHEMLHLPPTIQPDHIEIFRHPHAIPQYTPTTDERLATIHKLQTQHPGLIIAGNLRDGISMAHRIQQATKIANQL